MELPANTTATARPRYCAGTSPIATTATTDQKMAWASAITTRAATSQA